MCGALSDERSSLLQDLASAFFLGAHSCGTHDHILLSQIWDFPNLQGQVPEFISHRNRIVQFIVEWLELCSLINEDLLFPFSIVK
jgi:hypothetical protein